MNKQKIAFKNKLLCVLMLWGVGILLWRLLNTEEILLGDVKDYWYRGNDLWKDGRFSLLNIDGFRGYVYPVYLGVLSRIRIGGVERLGFVIVNTSLVSMWFVLVEPKMHNYEIVSFKDCARCILHFCLFGMLYYGLVIYSLSDLFAIMLCGLSVIIEKRLEACKGAKSLGLGLLLGIMVYCLYNVRTIYMFAGIYLISRLIYFLIKVKTINILKKFGLLCLNILGISIAALPQIYMNYFQLGVVSLKVPTNGLMFSQMMWGIQWQRYETFVGNNNQHPMPQMYFLDPIGNTLLEKSGEISNWHELIGFILDYPLEIAGIYIRHIVNALLPCWPNSYVVDMDNNKVFYIILSYTMLFIFGTALLNKLFDKHFLYNYVALLLPVLFISPGGVEARFFAAVYILIVGTLCYNLNWNGFMGYVKENKAKLSAMFFLLGGLLVAIWGSMLACESAYPILF